ncbi:outer-membrane lipoprotein carrier protein LolA [Crenobacter sp. SG2303]|uniref:Outer-membrane lipoprotein carrier protein LolA n=1 Tax=Crenobacter oryzisoli TaxID=3056844 RepID=A0ABT7XIX7_9NEIS|nr:MULTISPECIES: LolA-related protein [unclassified Crenobacter]MDN0073743.1 outer-membrane lipoprotein carrier protein LolA [Crenobacter sp. SG2303]MDN0082727.1 outer-membrane lipoprotein carrier protein LolA [Crenobacter sp. SG2305]
MTRRFLALLLCALPLMASAADFDLDRLLGQLAQTRSAHATFTEKQYLTLLDKPLESSGELAYEAPGHLEKRTLQPKVESLVLDGGTLTVERGGKRHVLKLQDYPEIAAFIDSIRATMAGDRRALEAAYRTELDGRYERWTLQLTPTAPKMLAKVSRVKISGVRADLRQIEIVQADGDRSVMSIARAAP